MLKHYSEQEHIQKAEASILKLLKPKLSEMKMLDIGVGAGRTTMHFAHLVKEYMGIDYAKLMIDSCRKKFSGYRFETMDVRNMSPLPSNHFDFVLFSHNGIDNMPYQDRERSLQEIARVLKQSGIFVFSTHNIHSIEALLSTISPVDSPPRKTLKWVKNGLFILMNGHPSKLKNLPYVVVNDGSWNFRLRTYYIDPRIQLRELEALGFRNSLLFSGSTGERIARNHLAMDNDPWIYFLCTHQLPL